ncbi:hypothetical protein Y032_0021g272 [Ancylostoma ceylanicum]|uniref:Uncharacterized protein n=1 Tax=Ancylostoma ceylanicum TaxID=53326 RepID=A0A016UZI6_9BILA|nr:hypothetical protein Y032_0021g272 [Ancylostoma ceylanicum]
MNVGVIFHDQIFFWSELNNSRITWHFNASEEDVRTPLLLHRPPTLDHFVDTTPQRHRTDTVRVDVFLRHHRAA